MLFPDTQADLPLGSPLYTNKANKPGYGQPYIFGCAKATIKWPENQSNQGCMAKVMQ
jgi:hypothetical protein